MLILLSLMFIDFEFLIKIKLDFGLSIFGPKYKFWLGKNDQSQYDDPNPLIQNLKTLSQNNNLLKRTIF